MTSPPSLSWLVGLHKHFFYGPSPSRLQLLVCHSPGKIFSSEDGSSPVSLINVFKVQLGWHFCSAPYNSQSGTHILEDRKCFWWWLQKHQKDFAVPSARETTLTLDEAIFLPELHLPSCGRIFPYVDAKYSTLGISVLGCVSRILCS
jgi:hypothetical protein